jgi:ATP-dependent RNA helicase DHX37/DHR1
MTSLVRVSRTKEIETQRSKLPAVLTEQEVVDAVRNNDFSIISGDTGCGKSTQVPQFLYESGFTEGANEGLLIGVTQPRRVAAVSVAERVGVELNDSSLVGYQVRYDRKIDEKKIRIKFMTDGILLREVQQDITLAKYSVIVIDEAHERSINCDMLLGLLSGSIRARKAQSVKDPRIRPLRVVVMSATLRLTDFTQSGLTSAGSLAVVNIDNRMHPVIVHYDRTTASEYLPLVTDKITKIHKTLPQGSILVFVTGKGEVHQICNSFRKGTAGEEEDEDLSTEGEAEEQEESPDQGRSILVEDFKRIRTDAQLNEGDEPDFNLGAKDEYTEELTFKNGLGVEVEAKSKHKKSTPKEKSEPKPPNAEIIPFIGGGPGSKLRVFPLYAQMSSDRQKEVFRAAEEYPEDRIVVVATNVAETSLTIPNVRYVIDCGREKRKEYNSNGVSRFAIRFTAKSSANQRAGRAGRVGPGHVYRLYSPNVFGEHMAEFPSPEIETNPLDSAILFLRSMGVPSVKDFPWPSPPPDLHVEAAMRRLKAIGAMDLTGRITALGKQISQFPVSPRLAVALVILVNHQQVPKDQKNLVALMLISAVAMCSVECLSDSQDDQKSREIAITQFSDDVDMVVSSFVDWMALHGREEREKLCMQRGLNQKAMEEAKSLFFLLCRQAMKMDQWKHLVSGWGNKPEETLLVSKSKERKNLMIYVRECLTHSFVDQIAVLEEAGSKAYRAPACSDEVYIFRFSAVYRLRPRLLAYGDMQQSITTARRSMRMCFPVDPEYLANLDSPLIDRSKAHPMMRPMVLQDGRKIAFVVPKYTPLSLTLVDCLKVDVSGSR